MSAGNGSRQLCLNATAVPLVVGGTSLLLSLKRTWGTLTIVRFLAGISPPMHDFSRNENPGERMNDKASFPESEWQEFHHSNDIPASRTLNTRKMFLESSTPPPLPQQFPGLYKLLHRPRRGKFTRRNPALAMGPLVKLPYPVHT